MVGQTVVLQSSQCGTGYHLLQHHFPGIKQISHPAAIKTTHIQLLKSPPGKSYQISPDNVTVVCMMGGMEIHVAEDRAGQMSNDTCTHV